jgi:C-1 hydroxylase
MQTYTDAYNDKAWDRLRGCLSADYVHHSGSDDLDADQFVRGAMWLLAGLPDLRVAIDDVVAEDDRIAMRYTLSGTHTASMMGETPTLRTIALHGITIFRLADGLIAEDWEGLDYADLQKQIGVAS